MTLDRARLMACIAFLDGAAEEARQMAAGIPEARTNAQLMEDSASALRELLRGRQEQGRAS